MLSKNKGVVEQWFPEKGWGFIREVNNGIVNKYFVHHRNVISGSIKLNARVQFNYGIREKGMYAIEVEVLPDLTQGVNALAAGEVRNG